MLPCSSLEQYKEFQEECYSIALHPSGLYILVGFSDKLRLMNLLIDDIRSFKEFTIRGCREVSLQVFPMRLFQGLFLERTYIQLSHHFVRQNND